MADNERKSYSRLAQAPAEKPLPDIQKKPLPTVHAFEADEKLHGHDMNRLHWKAPALLACSLLAGAVFAVTHHLYYRYWDGRKASSGTQQEWIVRGGTFFAFAFKVSLAAGGGVAYVQFLWMSLSKRPYKVRDVDSMFSVLSSPLAFRYLKLWAKLPLLTLVAALVWSMPLAAIITPGSLTVALTQDVTSETARVPTLDFQSLNFGNSNGLNDDFVGASDGLVRLGLATATSGSVLAMQPPQPNSTYTTTFHGPALQCHQGSLSDLTAINAIINIPELRNILEYMAWAPGQGVGIYNYTYAPLQMPGLSNADFSSPIQNDAGANLSYPDLGYNVYIYSPRTPSAFLIRCALYNVTYTVNFSFSGGSQTFHIQTSPKEDLIPLGAAFDYDPYNGLNLPQKYNEVISYLSVMYSFGSIVTGSITSLAQTGTPIVQSTIIQSTQLAPYASSTIPDATPDNATVRAAFEELFQNITFSLFSSNNYLLNASDPAQARDVQTPTITSSRFVNKYTYNAYSLWLAYGLALAGEVTCLTIGFFALYSNRVAFTNGFSTILRATRNKELGQLVAGDEFNGADPVPEDMLDAMISYRLGDGQTAGFGISSHRVAR